MATRVAQNILFPFFSINLPQTHSSRSGARKGLVDAHKALVDAHKALVDAHKGPVDSHKGPVDAHTGLADARLSARA